MPYFLGKNTNAPLDRGRFSLDMGELDKLHETPVGRSTSRPIAPIDFKPYTPPRERVPVAEMIAQPEGGADLQGESYVDELMASLFGEGFETIRGIGGRSREGVYDLLAREGLLGTGAAKDVASEMAWQTEQGISNLIRDMGKMRADKESEAMNMIMTWLGMTSNAWG